MDKGTVVAVSGIRGIAEALSVSRQKVYALIEGHWDFPAVKVDGIWMADVEELRAWLRRQKAVN